MRLHALPRYLRQFRFLNGIRFYIADLVRAMLDPHARGSYAQWGEDAALRFLHDEKAGFYVEVGANHPQYFSNTFDFYRRGWHGITIEANEAFRKPHQRLRPRDRFVCAVVSNEDREVIFTEFEESLISSIHPEFVEQMRAMPGRRVKREHRVRTRTLTAILDESGCPAIFDFLSIDVEGHGYEVLASLDLGRYRPRVVVIEMHGFTCASAADDRVVRLMREAGYSLVGHLATNSYFTASRPAPSAA